MLRVWFYTHYPVAHLLHYILIWHIFQMSWPCWDSFITHFLCFKMIRDIFQQPWVFFNCPNTHPLCLILIRDMPKGFWFYIYCLNTLSPGLKVIKNLSYPEHGKFIQGNLYLYLWALTRVKFYGQMMIFVSDNLKNNDLLLLLQFSCLSFFIFRSTPIPSWWVLSNE